MEIVIFWFRRDLRFYDNTGLYHALKSKYNVLPLFIFDTNIIKKLDNPSDARISFIYQELKNLHEKFLSMDSGLEVRIGEPLEVFKQLTKKYTIPAVFTNHDYEPYAIVRDRKVLDYLETQNIQFKTFKDQVIFEKNEIVKKDGKPYTIFTPYSKVWKKAYESLTDKSYPSEEHLQNLLKFTSNFPAIEKLGFKPVKMDFSPSVIPIDIIKNYDKTRDYPSIEGTSRLSVHLRFGTISIRELTSKAKNLNSTFLNELIWREFYMMILYHFSYVENKPFKKKYEHIEWNNDEKDFEKWKKGETGYPFVDAGMRQLNETGWMHNRLRMITASFLTKHLLIDWRWGEAYFAEKLLDYELASNNGGWQWAAGTGCDAAPYFRIFNPYTQQKRFDPKGKFIQQWVPGIQSKKTIKPIIDHKFARERALATYKRALSY